MSKWSSWRSFTKYWSRVILHLSHKVRKNWYFFSFCRFAKELYPNIEILIGILETITHQRAPTKDIRCFRIYLGLFQNSSRISQPSAFLKEKLKNTAEKLNRMRWWIKCLFFHTAMELFNNSFNFDRNSAHKMWWLRLECLWSPSYISVYLPWFVICELFISNTKPKEFLRMNHLYFTYYRNISDHSTKIRLGFSILYYF